MKKNTIKKEKFFFFFFFPSAQLLGLYQKGAVLRWEEAGIGEKALRLEKVLGLSLVDYLPCVLRNEFYISYPNYSNKMLILELRPASTHLFLLSASAEA